jgi:protein phosphatase
MVDAFGLSDPGSVRTNNEDYFLIDRAAGIFVLADGMGGAQAGEHAARLGVERLYTAMRSSDPGDVAALEGGFQNANQAVLNAARANPAFDGMGTTLLAARTAGDGELLLGSVGDSRAYLASKGELRLLTHDQTWVAEVGPKLGLTEEGMKHHPMRHVLTMAIGCSDQLRVAAQAVPVTSGDQLLLCSDGLHGVVEEDVIAAALNSEKSLEEKCHSLVEAAKDRGGPDNVTVVLIRLT